MECYLSLTLQIGVMSEPGHSARACQSLFLACEHYWHPILLFRLIAHRYRCHAPATPLPDQHVQIFLVLRVWLNSSSGLFVAVPGLALELRTFLSSLFALGGVYRATADELGQLAVRIPPGPGEPYASNYSAADHERQYQVSDAVLIAFLTISLLHSACSPAACPVCWSWP